MDMSEQLLDKAKWAEEARRYEDMAKFMKELVEMGQKFSSEGRNLLSVAYKNVVGSRRNAWRVITGNLQQMKDDGAKARATEYQKCIQEELTCLCKEVVKLIDDHLLKEVLNGDTEGLVFYTKMKGDYYRYLCEVVSDGAREDCVHSSEECYKKASEHALELVPVHPIRLGLVLNFSVFYYEIMNTPDTACEMAKVAFDEAIADLDSLKEDSYKDSTLIMQLLRDNITLWTSSEDYDQS